MFTKAKSIELSIDERKQIEFLLRAGKTPQKVVNRCKIIMESASGKSNNKISKELSISRPTIISWKNRFEEEGVKGLLRDESRPGRKKAISEEQVKSLLEATLHTTPENATHWTTRTMAKSQGLSHMAVQRIWKEYNLQPHRTEAFKLSTDPNFVEKLTDVVGLYMNPPEKALVLSVDEKSQIQALDRTQPGLPMKKGRCGTMTHDYKRHGTTTLFAALNMLDGTVIGECKHRHRAKEFISFLKTIDKQTPSELDLHIIVDNYRTHKTQEVQRWLKKHPRFHFHFTPTSSSWLNMVERWFREITDKRIRRGVFKSVEELVTAIYGYLDAHNADPKIFTWTKDADTILKKVNHCKEALVTLH